MEKNFYNYSQRSWNFIILRSDIKSYWKKIRYSYNSKTKEWNFIYIIYLLEDEKNLNNKEKMKIG